MIYDGKPVYCGDEPYPVYKPDRRVSQAFIVNSGATEARLGSYKVQIDTGIPIGPGIALVLETPSELSQEWYAISESGTEITVTTMT